MSWTASPPPPPPSQTQVYVSQSVLQGPLNSDKWQGQCTATALTVDWKVGGCWAYCLSRDVKVSAVGERSWQFSHEKLIHVEKARPGIPVRASTPPVSSAGHCEHRI